MAASKIRPSQTVEPTILKLTVRRLRSFRRVVASTAASLVLLSSLCLCCMPTASVAAGFGLLPSGQHGSDHSCCPPKEGTRESSQADSLPSGGDCCLADAALDAVFAAEPSLQVQLPLCAFSPSQVTSLSGRETAFWVRPITARGTTGPPIYLRIASFLI